MKRLLIPALFSIVFFCSSCFTNQEKKTNNTEAAELGYWLTKADQSVLLKKQTATLLFDTSANNYSVIDVDSTQTFQTIDGFGYTLTGGSAQLINGMTASAKTTLLQELFGKDTNSISISYLRISIAASDLDSIVYSYDDMPAGQTDLKLDHFSLAADKTGVIPLLKEILLINPAIKILGSPWSPPKWMKDNDSTKGGSLKREYYSVYAQYLVKYIQQMKAKGITIDAITPQNEPLHPGNNPSMYMTAAMQAAFIKNNLGPAFKTAGITTKIIVYDHNCDHPEYPLEILNDTAARQFVDGSAFHLYNGDISALSQVHNAHPDKNVYFTEQWTGANGTFDGDLQWHVKNVIIGSVRNWSRIALEWNLAIDPSFKPHSPGGCTECRGALTINSSAITRNVAYYIVAHASKFVPAGSVRIASNNIDSLSTAAFKRPDGKNVLIVLNEAKEAKTFNINFNAKWTTPTLPANSVATFVW